MSEKKKLAMEFEQSVKRFLEKLEFDDVDGAKDTFKINSIQVDACGGFEGTLLIVECCMAVELKAKPLANRIKEFRGESTALEKGIKGHPTYKKYDRIRYVLATKNIEVRRADIEFANAYNPRIYMWDENFMEYYEDLYEKIGKYAKFNLLGEMNIRPIQKNPISIPAFMALVGGKRMYSFVINPKDLLEISYVARSLLAENLEFVLNKLLERCRAFSSEKQHQERTSLLLQGKAQTPSQDQQGLHAHTHRLRKGSSRQFCFALARCFCIFASDHMFGEALSRLFCEHLSGYQDRRFDL